MRNKNQETKMRNQRKQRLGLAALVLIVMFAIGTTFAFQQLNQTALNPDRVAALPGGRIHDVFQARGETDVSGTRNKNVFAENWGSNPIGVRVQFQEFLMLNDIPIYNDEGNLMDLNAPETWNIVRFDNEMNRIDSGATATVHNTGISWRLGQTNEADDVKIFMPTFNRVNRQLPADPANGLPNAITVSQDILDDPYTIFNHDFVYQFSEVSGRGVEGIAGGMDITNTAINNIDDIEAMGTQTGPSANHTGEKDYWDLDEVFEAYRYTIVDNELVRTLEEHTAKATLTPVRGGVMAISEWNRLGRPAGNFWIFDDLADIDNPLDAWFYWNGFIPGGEATSLLLNETFLPVHANLEYVIRINADFFTADGTSGLYPPIRTCDVDEVCPDDILRPGFWPNVPANPIVPGLTCGSPAMLNLGDEWECNDVLIDPTNPDLGTTPEVTGPGPNPFLPRDPECADLNLAPGWNCREVEGEEEGGGYLVVYPDPDNITVPGVWTPPTVWPDTCEELREEGLPLTYECQDGPNYPDPTPGYPIVTPPSPRTCENDYLPLPEGTVCDGDNLRPEVEIDEDCEYYQDLHDRQDDYFWQLWFYQYDAGGILERVPVAIPEDHGYRMGMVAYVRHMRCPHNGMPFGTVLEELMLINHCNANNLWIETHGSTIDWTLDLEIGTHDPMYALNAWLGLQAAGLSIETNNNGRRIEIRTDSEVDPNHFAEVVAFVADPRLIPDKCLITGANLRGNPLNFQ